MSQISYLIKQDAVKTTRKKQWVMDNYSYETGVRVGSMDGYACLAHATPVKLEKTTECTIIENPIITKLRKKFKQAKVQIRERAFHMHGVAYVELVSA